MTKTVGFFTLLEECLTLIGGLLCIPVLLLAFALVLLGRLFRLVWEFIHFDI